MSIYSKIIRIVLLLSILVLIGIYVLLGLYYSDGFAYGTWINGVYCTGKSVQEVNELLKQSCNYSKIKIYDKNGKYLEINTEDINYRFDFTNELDKYIGNKHFLLWGSNLFLSDFSRIEPETSFDYDKVFDIVSNSEIFDISEGGDVYIKLTSEGYELVNEKKDKPVLEKIMLVIDEALYNQEKIIKLEDFSECYVSAELTDKEKETLDTFEKIEVIEAFNKKMNIGNTIVELNKSDIDDWIVIDTDMSKFFNKELSDKGIPYEGDYIIDKEITDFPEQYNIVDGFVMDMEGNLVISEKKILDYIDDIAIKYDSEWSMNSYLESRDFENINSKPGKVETVDGKLKVVSDENGENSESDSAKSEVSEGYYSNEVLISSRKDGLLIDSKRLTDLLIEDFLLKDSSEMTIPLYDGVSSVNGLEVLGDTFILVDMKNQHLTYYHDGKIKNDYDIVTGNTKLGRGTPVGVYNIYNKRYHTVLRGDNYASYVNYWLGVHKGIGIHDATWRNKFGGEIYKTNGSHGCINSPLEKMEKLYEEVEVGTPVIMHY